MNRSVLLRAVYVAIILIGVGVSAWALSKRLVEQRITDDATTIALASSRAIHQQLSLLDDIPAGSAASCDALFVTMLDQLAREHPGVAGVFVQQPGEGNRFCSEVVDVSTRDLDPNMLLARPDILNVDLN